MRNKLYHEVWWAKRGTIPPWFFRSSWSSTSYPKCCRCRSSKYQRGLITKLSATWTIYHILFRSLRQSHDKVKILCDICWPWSILMLSRKSHPWNEPRCVPWLEFIAWDLQMDRLKCCRMNLRCWLRFKPLESIRFTLVVAPHKHSFYKLKEYDLGEV